MEQSIGEALAVMIVGMITVFIILWLVVLIGNSLIRLTNKFWPESEVAKKEKGKAQKPVGNDATIAAIVAAVDIVTKGKGKITNITELR